MTTLPFSFQVTHGNIAKSISSRSLHACMDGWGVGCFVVSSPSLFAFTHVPFVPPFLSFPFLLVDPLMPLFLKTQQRGAMRVPCWRPALWVRRPLGTTRRCSTGFLTTRWPRERQRRWPTCLVSCCESLLLIKVRLCVSLVVVV